MDQFNPNVMQAQIALLERTIAHLQQQNGQLCGANAKLLAELEMVAQDRNALHKELIDVRASAKKTSPETQDTSP